VRARREASGGGRIVNITLVHEAIASPGQTADDASKAGAG